MSNKEVQVYRQKFEEGSRDPQEACVRTEILPDGVAPHISAGLVEIPPGGFNDSNPHHDKTQIYFVLEGRGTFVLGEDREIPVDAESVVEVPVGVRHMMRADRGTAVRYIYVNDPLNEE